MPETRKLAEVRRILDRYLVEVVERYELCPWARSARGNGEIAVEVVLGEPSLDAWVDAAKRALARPGTRVAMVVAPQLVIERQELHEVRDRVSKATGAGVAEFHPDAPLDLVTPARLVPFLRRSPDPMLQLVPMALLVAMRGPQPNRMHQAQILGGHMAPPRDVGDAIAAANHTRVSLEHAAIEATLAAIAEDRRTAYVSVGLSECR